MTAMPSFHENNIHSIEFEAPLSADPTSSAAARRHFSIDLSLELERQLDMETFPPTPAHNAESHLRHDSSTENGNVKYESLDPHVLAHIVQQLRQSLSDMTKDRDELLQMVASVHSHETELKEALQHMTDKATTMEVELSDARSKIRDDEDAITMLRTKVEESRRGLMRLQTESRRQSMAPATLDLSRAGLPAFGSPPSSKRASFTPLTGSFTARPIVGHRRISSTDTGTGVPEFSTSPNSQATPLPEAAPPNAPPVSSRRYSGLFGRTSPPQSDPGYVDILSTEIQGLRKEMHALKDELETMKHELSESNEAREASETCVKALREFIAENNVGAHQAAGSSSLTLPPPPTMTSEEESKTAAAGGWGFKLWKDATVRSPAVPQPAAVPSPAVAQISQVPQPATPLSRKIGGFFSSHKSGSSIASSINTPPPTTLPQLQTNAAASVRDSMYSFSDASSMAEPISPPNEFDGNIFVRDVTNISELGSLNTAHEVGKGMHVEQDARPGVVVA